MHERVVYECGKSSALGERCHMTHSGRVRCTKLTENPLPAKEFQHQLTKDSRHMEQPCISPNQVHKSQRKVYRPRHCFLSLDLALRLTPVMMIVMLSSADASIATELTIGAAKSMGGRVEFCSEADKTGRTPPPVPSGNSHVKAPTRMLRSPVKTHDAFASATGKCLLPSTKDTRKLDNGRPGGSPRPRIVM